MYLFWQTIKYSGFIRLGRPGRLAQPGAGPPDRRVAQPAAVHVKLAQSLSSQLESQDCVTRYHYFILHIPGLASLLLQKKEWNIILLIACQRVLLTFLLRYV